MQKTELIAQVAKTSGLTQKQAGDAVNATIDAITAALKAGDKVTLTGFGSFQVRETAARTGVNPRTRQKLNIPAGKRATFTAGAGLKGAVTGKASAAKKPSAKRKKAKGKA